MFESFLDQRIVFVFRRRSGWNWVSLFDSARPSRASNFTVQSFPLISVISCSSRSRFAEVIKLSNRGLLVRRIGREQSCGLPGQLRLRHRPGFAKIRARLGSGCEPAPDCRWIRTAGCAAAVSSFAEVEASSDFARSNDLLWAGDEVRLELLVAAGLGFDLRRAGSAVRAGPAVPLFGFPSRNVTSDFRSPRSRYLIECLDCFNQGHLKMQLLVRHPFHSTFRFGELIDELLQAVGLDEAGLCRQALLKLGIRIFGQRIRFYLDTTKCAGNLD